MKRLTLCFLCALALAFGISAVLSLRYQTTGNGTSGIVYVLDRWTGKVLFCYGAECEPAETKVELPATETKVELPAARRPPKTRELLTDNIGLFDSSRGEGESVLIDDAGVLERQRRRYKVAEQTEQVEDVY